MTRPAVLLLEPLHASARARLDEWAQVVELGSPDASLDQARGGVPLESIGALITRGRGQVDEALLDRLPGLRVVARAGVGLDNVALEPAKARGVRVLNVPDALTTTVAEHAIALALAVRRGIPHYATAAKEGRWERRLGYSGASVAGARTAIVGLGSIGSRAALLFSALGAEVTAWSRTPREAPEGVARFEPVLERALAGASIVSVHVGLHGETRDLLNGERLALLAPGATVVNTARPGIVHRASMLAALEAGQVGAYAVDGFEPEPPDVDDELLGHPRCLVTPHVAALTEETFCGLCMDTVEGVRDALEGREPTGGARRVV